MSHTGMVIGGHLLHSLGGEILCTGIFQMPIHLLALIVQSLSLFDVYGIRIYQKQKYPYLFLT